MTKQEVIKNAYGEHWENVKDYVDEDGWCNALWNICEILDGITHPNSCGTLWRPKSLQGIENNNGWIKIESEADLLLISDDQDYYCGLMDIDGNFHQRNSTKSANYIRHESRLGYINRYQPINRPLKPLY